MYLSNLVVFAYIKNKKQQRLKKNTHINKQQHKNKNVSIAFDQELHGNNSHAEYYSKLVRLNKFLIQNDEGNESKKMDLIVRIILKINE